MISATQGVLGLLCGAMVGFSLGLVGGGGSVLAVPLMVYVVGVPEPHIAIGSSAIAVATNAAVNLVNHARGGTVIWPIAALFAVAGIVGAFGGSLLGKMVDGQKLLALFALVMMVIAMLMLKTRARVGIPDVKMSMANFPAILGFGLATGTLSGFFGIGGGFLMTPLLIFVGITPAVAVASVSSHIAASSFSGALSYWRRRAIDPSLALVLMIGGTLGTALGVSTFTLLRSLGQLDLMIALSYVALLTSVGGVMFWEGLRAIMRARQGALPTVRRPGSHVWIHGLPLKMRFKRSKIYVSVIPVIGIGLLIGFLGAVMGIGGGFILVPLLIYILRVPTSTVIGTSMVLTLATMMIATMLHAVSNHLVDAVLALILMVGGVTGAQFGARAGQMIRGEQLRLLLGLLILAVGIRFAVELVIRPADLFTIRETEQSQ